MKTIEFKLIYNPQSTYFDGELWGVCCEYFNKEDRIITDPHCVCPISRTMLDTFKLEHLLFCFTLVVYEMPLSIYQHIDWPVNIFIAILVLIWILSRKWPKSLINHMVTDRYAVANSIYLKWLRTWLFVQHLVYIKNKREIKYFMLMGNSEGNHLWLMNSLHTGK